MGPLIYWGTNVCMGGQVLLAQFSAREELETLKQAIVERKAILKAPGSLSDKYVELSYRGNPLIIPM